MRLILLTDAAALTDVLFLSDRGTNSFTKWRGFLNAIEEAAKAALVLFMVMIGANRFARASNLFKLGCLTKERMRDTDMSKFDSSLVQ